MDGRTFFCRRTTLVHFFSSKPSYFFEVAASKESPICSSSLRALAALGRLLEERYAMMALCLGSLGVRRGAHYEESWWGRGETNSSSAWRGVRIWLILALRLEKVPGEGCEATVKKDERGEVQ